MSTTAAEPAASAGQQDQLAPEPKDKTGSSSREYVILFQRSDKVWEELDRVTATDVEGALNSLGSKLDPNKKYVAVAERYWRPASPEVETVTTVTLKFD